MNLARDVGKDGDAEKSYYKQYSNVVYSLQNRIDVEESLEALSRLDKTLTMPRQLYKDAVKVLEKLLVEERYIKPALETWTCLIISRGDQLSLDSFFEFVFMLTDPHHFVSSVRALFGNYRLYFFKYLRELEAIDELKDICDDLKGEYRQLLGSMQNEDP